MAKREIRPWYRWWWHEYRTSERVLAFCSLSVHGAYQNLLAALWERNGVLPTDRNVLWKLALANSKEEYEAVADQVEAMFERSEDGTALLSERMTEEWDNSTNFLESKAKAGRASGDARKRNKQGTDVQQVSNTPRTISSSSSSSKTGEEERTTPPPNSDLLVFEIARTHPKLTHLRDETEIPNALATTIIRAIQKDGDEVLVKTRNYRDAVAKWPEHEQKFAMKPYEFFGTFEYRKDPKTWAGKVNNSDDAIDRAFD